MGESRALAALGITWILLFFPTFRGRATVGGMIRRFAILFSTIVLVLSFVSTSSAAPFFSGGKITQSPDGQIVFPVEDKKEATDNSIRWSYKPTRWGMYDLVLLYPPNTPKLGKVDVEIAGQKFTIREAIPEQEGLEAVSVAVKQVYLAAANPFDLRVTSSEPAAVSTLYAALLRPAPEGKPIVQDSESITLHARDATTHSVMMRYEPATNKLCLGYWTNPKDSASWSFDVTKPDIRRQRPILGQEHPTESMLHETMHAQSILSDESASNLSENLQNLFTS